MTHLVKTDIQHIFRDESSGALINKNNPELNAYKQKKVQIRKMKKMETQIEMLEKRIEMLVDDIKQLQQQVL